MSVIADFLDYCGRHSGELVIAIQEHLILLVGVPVALAALVAIPIGIMATRWRWLESIALGIAGILQTIPSLALLSFMIPLGLGIGYKPAIVAIFLYALLPIVRNTYTGIKSVDPFMKKAARGMGMTDFQCLLFVELPIAIPVILAGIRTSTTISIGTGTLAAFIGAGGLGQFIVTGLRMVRDHIILAGALPAALMAVLIDVILNKVEKLITPRGLRL